MSYPQWSWEKRLIKARATHLDSLVARLQEDRVKKYIEPMVAGKFTPTDGDYDDDLSYLVDLGLVKDPPLVVANPIYKEVIVRVLSAGVQSNLVVDPRNYVLPDGRFDIDHLIGRFMTFWTRQGHILAKQQKYEEAAAQLVMHGYLQAAVNGHGMVDCEYGLGRNRMDLLVRWPYTDADRKRTFQEEALELKVWGKGESDPLEEGLEQLDGYLGKLRLDHGYLVIFNCRHPDAPLEQRGGIERITSPAGRDITLLRA